MSRQYRTTPSTSGNWPTSTTSSNRGNGRTRSQTSCWTIRRRSLLTSSGATWATSLERRSGPSAAPWCFPWQCSPPSVTGTSPPPPSLEKPWRWCTQYLEFHSCLFTCKLTKLHHAWWPLGWCQPLCRAWAYYNTVDLFNLFPGQTSALSWPPPSSSATARCAGVRRNPLRSCPRKGEASFF